MNAYEFTRFEADRTYRLKAQGYDIDVVAMQIDYNNPDKNYFRGTDEYEEAKHMFIEVTMSCNQQECIQWMEYFMLNAIAYGLDVRELNWRAYFMAAYDLYNSLSGREYRQKQTEEMLRFTQRA